MRKYYSVNEKIKAYRDLHICPRSYNKLEAKSGLNPVVGNSKGWDTSPIRSKQSIHSFPENMWGMYFQGSCNVIKWVRKHRIIKVLIPKNILTEKTPSNNSPNGDSLRKYCYIDLNNTGKLFKNSIY